MMCDLFSDICKPDITDISDLPLMKYESSLCVILQNIRSSSRNADEFFSSISSLPPCYQEIICLSETWHKFGNIGSITGYKVYENSSGHNKSSGVGLLVKDNLSSERFITYSEKIHSRNCDLVTACINTGNMIQAKLIYTTVMYRSPSGCKADFLNIWKDLLEESCGKNLKSIITGDFNINILKTNDTWVDDFKEITSNFGFRILTTSVTRKGIGTPSSLDLIITNIVCNTFTNIIDLDITDHYTVLTSFDINTSRKVLSNKKFSKYIDFKKVTTYLSNYDFTESLIFDDPNDSLLCIIDIINKELTRNTSFKKIKVGRFAEIKQKWMSTSLLRSLKRKNKIKYKLNKNPGNSTLALKYIKYRNILNSLMKNAKRKYYDDLFKKNENNKGKLWKNIKSLTSNNDENSVGCLPNLWDGENKHWITGEKNIADYVNNFFTRFEEDLLNEDDFRKSCKKECESIFLKPTNISEICLIMNSLSNSKATSYDNLSNRLIKSIPSLIPILVTIGNRILESGIFPSCLKKGIIVTKFKGGAKDQIANYRPITILSPLAKIFEKLLAVRMEDYLKRRNLLNKNQFAFRKGIGTEEALHTLADALKEARDRNKYTIAATVDLEKAFDNISHKALLIKLEAMGFRGNCYSLLSSYLHRREIFTKVGDSISNVNFLKRGVPQGSVLGPLLFNIFLFDLRSEVNDIQMINYADDNLTFGSGNNLLNLSLKIQRQINALNDWYKWNKLKINVLKCKIIIFGSKRNLKKAPKLVFTMNGVVIEECTEVKYLGLTFDSSLSWKNHIVNKLNECSYFFPTFYRLRKILNFDTLLKIFNALYMSKLTYGLSIYGATYKSTLSKINLNIKNIMRIICFKKKHEHIYPTMKSFGVRNIYQQHLIECCRILRCILNQNWNANCKQIIFNKYVSKGNFDLRKNKNYLVEIPKFHNDFGKFKLYNRLCYFINFAYSKNINLLELDYGNKCNKTTLIDFVMNFVKIDVHNIF